VPGALDAVFQKMVAKRPEDRHQSMSELISALKACAVQSEPVVRSTGTATPGDGALTSFLANLAQSDSAPRPTPPPIAEETIKADAEEDTNRNLWTKLAHDDRRKTWTGAAIVGGVLVLAVLLGVIFMPGKPTTPPGPTRGADQSPPPRPPEARPTKVLVTTSLRTTLDGFSDPVTSFAFGPDGKKLATNGNGRGILAVWDAVEGKKVVSKRAHDEVVSGIDFADNGQKVAASTYQRTTIWTLPSGNMNHQFGRQQGSVKSVAFAPGSQQMATACSAKTIWMWDVTTAQPLWKVSDAASYDDLDFSPDGRFLGSCGYDSMVRLWDVATGDPVSVLEGHGERVRAVDFSHDGGQIASASEDSTSRIWDVASGKTLIKLDHPDKVWAVSFSCDRVVVATGCEDGKVRLWNATTGELLQELDGHKGPVRCITFAPRGDLLASGADDKTIRLWDFAIDHSPAAETTTEARPSTSGADRPQLAVAPFDAAEAREAARGHREAARGQTRYSGLHRKHSVVR
jgi:WD40 repeat protein